MDDETFVVTDDHLKLLQHAYVGWEDCEFGAPAIDCKRPYGNSSVYLDIAEILGIEPEGDDDGYGERDFTRDQKDAMRKFHVETQTVLQIALATGSFEPGTYICPKYSSNWVGPT